MKEPIGTAEPSMDDVLRLLQINHATLFLLTKAGHLPTFTARHPTRQVPAEAYSHEGRGDFQQTVHHPVTPTLLQLHLHRLQSRLPRQ